MKTQSRLLVFTAFLIIILAPLSGGQVLRQTFEREGIAIEFSMEDLAKRPPSDEVQFREGDTVVFRFSIRDTTSDTPLSSVYPAAWMDLRPEGETSDPQACQSKVESFIGGSLFSPPELDLNVYYVLALNDDASISVVDPLFGFGTTKLLNMIFLKSPGEDWALSNDQKHLFVSMPESGEVAVADTNSWKVVKNLEAGPEPHRVALQPDGVYLWAGYRVPRTGDQVSGVAVIDTRDLSVVARIPTGNGAHEIAFSPDSLHAFVTNRDDATLSIIDVGKREKIKDLTVGKNPTSLAFSDLSRSVYAVSQEEGTVTVVDARQLEVKSTIRAEPGLGQIKFVPDGRLGLLVNPEADVIHIIDAALDRIIQTGDIEDGPDQIAFSENLAYVRRRDSETVLMIPLSQIGVEGAPVPVVDFPGGQTPFGRGKRPTPADSIIQAPGATAVLVANPADQMIYFYKEGMAAPMGSFKNYGRQPLAVQVVDSSLREKSQPGVYETTAILRSPGTYDVAFFLDNPRTVHCFEVEVKPNPDVIAKRYKKMPVAIEPLFEGKSVTVGKSAQLDIRLVDPLTKKPHVGLKDVNILTFLGPGQEQKRQWAEQVKGEEGVYRVEFTPMHKGVYYVFVECRSLGLRYDFAYPTILKSVEETAQNGK